MSSEISPFWGGKGGGGSFRNRPDNLRSTDTFEALIGIAGVRAKLAQGGLKNLFVDGVPVEDGQGNASFDDFTALLFDGDPTVLDTVKLQLGQSSGPTNINLTLSNDYTNGAPGEWVNGVMPNRGVDHIDLRFVVQQLYKQTKKGSGDLTASIQIQLRPSGSTTWINPLLSVEAPPYSPEGYKSVIGYVVYQLFKKWDPDSGTPKWAESAPGVVQITGKTTSAYVKELRIAVPNEGAYANRSWEVRCRLIEREYVVSGDNGENEDRRTIMLESIAGVSAKPLGGTEEWRGLSYVQIYGKATDQITGVPEITGVYDFGEYPVPPASVWNPTTRLYTGAAWDGATTRVAWTQCPAFQIKGVIEDGLSGVSALVPGSTLNKWDALEASKWFAERVPDGRGGTQPRYSLNWFLEQGMKVDELVNYLAGAVGAVAWDEGDGRWRLKCERPEAPSMIFTKENIVGEFAYSHTDFDSRYNDYTGVYRDRDKNYDESRVRVYDQPNIDATGRRHTSIALVGCDNRQEALRRLKIRLLSSLNETKIVTFVTNRQGLLLERYSVIGVADGDLNVNSQNRTTGRIVSMSADRTRITVRDTLRLEIGVSYRLNLTVPNTSYTPETSVQPASATWRKPTLAISRAVVNTTAQRGNVVDIYLDAALPANVPEFAPIALEAPGLPALPKLYRVIGVTPAEDGELVTVTATEFYSTKWVESDNVDEDAILSQPINRIVPPPMLPPSGMFELRTFTSEFAITKLLVVSWMRPASTMLDKYLIQARHNGGAWRDLGTTRDTYFEMQSGAAGKWDFKVFAVDRRGAYSVPLYGTYELDDSLPQIPWEEAVVGPGKPESNATVGAPAGTLVGGREAGEIVASLDINAASIISQALRQEDAQLVLDARTFVDGQPVGNVFTQFRQDINNGINAVNSALTLLGAKTEDGTGWVLNLNAVQMGAGRSLGETVTDLYGKNDEVFRVLSQSLTELGSAVAGASALVTNLQETVVGLDGQGYARALVNLNVNGHITGFTQTNNGINGEFVIVADRFALVDPNGGAPFFPLVYQDNVWKMTNVEVDTLKAGSILTTNIGLNQVTGKTFWQVSWSGLNGTTLGASSEKVWAVLGQTGNKAMVSPRGGATPAGSEVCVRMYVNLQRTGSNNDRVWFRLRRDGLSTGSVILGDVVRAGMADYPTMVTYEWQDTSPTQDTYIYYLEYYRDAGEGTYYSAKLVCDLGKR